MFTLNNFAPTAFQGHSISAISFSRLLSDTLDKGVQAALEVFTPWCF